MSAYSGPLHQQERWIVAAKRLWAYFLPAEAAAEGYRSNGWAADTLTTTQWPLSVAAPQPRVNQCAVRKGQS
jgi:hypothetical protein